MKDSKRTQCVGAIFPDLKTVRFNKMTKRKAFSVFIEKVGCLVQRREMQRDEAEWEKCEECLSFDRRFRLSSAMALLWQGLQAAA